MKTNEDQALDELMRKLNTRRRVEWAEEMKLGRPALERLVQELNGKALTEWQLRNALLAVFRLRHHGDEGALFRLLLVHATDPRIKIRSTAATLAIGLLRLKEGVAADFRGVDDHAHVLRQALERGLENDAAKLVEDFLVGRASGFG